MIKDKATKDKVTKKSENDRRRRFRFRPEPGAAAVLYVNERGTKVAALISNESYAGCCLVILAGPSIKVERMYKIRVTEGLELTGEVRWIKKLGDSALQLGIEFVE